MISTQRLNIKILEITAYNLCTLIEELRAWLEKLAILPQTGKSIVNAVKMKVWKRLFLIK